MNPAFHGVGWELWRRSRCWLGGAMALLVLTGLANWLFGGSGNARDAAESVGYAMLVIALAAVFAAFHYTEGRRKGGFGSFPYRLFHLPIATRWLVGVPLACGILTTMGVYTAGAWLIFLPLGKTLPILWPCLYLSSALALFLMIIWSIPEHRYLKLFFLSLSAMGVSFCWMFFMPQMIEGTLSDWGYQGSVAAFQRCLFATFLFSIPAAYAVSVWRVGAQRHGGSTGTKGITLLWLKAWSVIARRRHPFQSSDKAIFWLEWRQTGLVLPLATGVVLALTCVPGYLSGPLSGQGTVGILAWLLCAPMVLAVIMGRGFAKPDFWRPELNVASFHAVRPVSSGAWVLAKLKVAFWSVALTWALVVYLTVIWLCFAGDFFEIERIYRNYKIYYGIHERWILAGLQLLGLMVLTWRFMVSGLSVGLSGRKRWYYLSNFFVALVLMAVFVLFILGDNGPDSGLHLYDLQAWSGWFPWLLGGLVIVKVWLAWHVWSRVRQRDMLSERSIYRYFACWLTITGFLMAGGFIAVPNIVWLRNLLLMAGLLVVPLASPGMAILALNRNRTHSA